MADQSVLTAKSFWDDNWEARKAHQVNLRHYPSYRIARLFDAYLPKAPQLMLEVGAGNSVWLPYLVKRYGYKVVGVDYSEMGCKLLNVNLKPYRNQSLVVQGDIFQNSLAVKTFDIVYSSGFIEHFTNYSEILDIFKSWLKPGGLLVTIVPNKKYAFRHVEKRLAPEVYDHHILMEPKDVAEAYRQIGMERVEAIYFGSFSTWKYNSYTRGMTHACLQAAARLLCWPVHTTLRLTGLEPESRTFSPMIFAIGTVPADAA